MGDLCAHMARIVLALHALRCAALPNFSSTALTHALANVSPPCMHPAVRMHPRPHMLRVRGSPVHARSAGDTPLPSATHPPGPLTSWCGQHRPPTPTPTVRPRSPSASASPGPGPGRSGMSGPFATTPSCGRTPPRAPAGTGSWGCPSCWPCRRPCQGDHMLAGALRAARAAFGGRAAPTSGAPSGVSPPPKRSRPPGPSSWGPSPPSPLRCGAEEARPPPQPWGLYAGGASGVARVAGWGLSCWRVCKGCMRWGPLHRTSMRAQAANMERGRPSRASRNEFKKNAGQRRESPRNPPGVRTTMRACGRLVLHQGIHPQAAEPEPAC